VPFTQEPARRSAFVSKAPAQSFGNFFAETAPQVQLRQIGKAWHLGKVLFEKWWLAPPGAKRSLIGWTVKAGGRLYGIPITL